MLDRLPASVRRRLEDGAKGLVAETPKPVDPCFAKVSNVLIGSADTAAKAARQALRKAGFDARIYSNQIVGEARECVKMCRAYLWADFCLDTVNSWCSTSTRSSSTRHRSVTSHWLAQVLGMPAMPVS